MNLSTREIYEIKPAGAESAARLLVASHVATFKKAGVTMVPGRSLAPGTTGVVPGPAGHFVFYGYAPGVIIYRYQRGDYVPVVVPEPERAPSRNLVPVVSKAVPARAQSPGAAEAELLDSHGEAHRFDRRSPGRVYRGLGGLARRLSTAQPDPRPMT